MTWQIGLGKCGPTDCCLTLTGPQGTKEYLIDSIAWKILEEYWDIPKQQARWIDPELASWIWDERLSDENLQRRISG